MKERPWRWHALPPEVSGCIVPMNIIRKWENKGRKTVVPEMSTREWEYVPYYDFADSVIIYEYFFGRATLVQLVSDCMNEFLMVIFYAVWLTNDNNVCAAAERQSPTRYFQIMVIFFYGEKPLLRRHVIHSHLFTLSPVISRTLHNEASRHVVI